MGDLRRAGAALCLLLAGCVTEERTTLEGLKAKAYSTCVMDTAKACLAAFRRDEIRRGWLVVDGQGRPMYMHCPQLARDRCR